MPSSTASSTLVVSVRWMLPTAPKRDTTSPRWRFSKYSIGSLTMWANTLLAHCRLSDMPKRITIQLRARPISVSISSNKAKPMTNTTNKSASCVANASSTTSWFNKGPQITNSSSTTASANTCKSERLRPSTLPVSADSATRWRLSAGLKSALGVSSKATPVKWRDTSAKGSLRKPTAGSKIVMLRRPTALSTTKWFRSQCKMQGRCNWPSSPSSSRTGRLLNCKAAA